MHHLWDHSYELFVFIGAMIGAIGSIVKAVNKSAKLKAARQMPLGRSMAQVNARPAATVAVAPRAAPMVPPVIPPRRASPSSRAVTADLGAVPPISPPVPSAEGMLVSGLFTQPRSLVAAFVASEILGPPVAFRHH